MPYFIYCRKSQEDEGRQVQSISDQLKSCRALAASSGIEIVDTIEESMSAKRPGRPRFDAMIKRIESGDADGILGWHPDRLARNAVDAGRILDLIDRGKLKDLKFESYRFENSPEGKWMLSIVLGQSKYFVDKLSKDVKRGLRSKLEKGHFPERALPGYLNDSTTKTIIIDPERFPLVRRAVDYLLTGAYSVKQVLGLLNNAWGFRTRKTTKTGGKPLSKSSFYSLLSNKFYIGMMEYDGEQFDGKHAPLMTTSEFDRLQQLVKKSKKNLRETGVFCDTKVAFSYTGLIKCGICGCQITASRKVKISRISKQEQVYIYYHCTNSKGGCLKLSISEANITKIIGGYLSRLWSDDDMKSWADAPTQRGEAEETSQTEQTVERLSNLLSSVEERKRRLIEDRYSLPGILSDEEFSEIKQRLQNEINELKSSIAICKQRDQELIDTIKNVADFSLRARSAFAEASEDADFRKQIARRLGLSYILSLGTLEIEVHPLLQPVIAIEPPNIQSGSLAIHHYQASFQSWYHIMNQIRTIAEQRPDLSFPALIDPHLTRA